MIYPSVYIAKGIPDPEHLKKRLHQDGFQNIFFVERSLVFQGECLQDSLQRLFAHIPENSFGLLYTVACGRRILDIPSTSSEAEMMLQLLSGRRHQVWSCFGFKSGSKVYSRIVRTRISFKRLTKNEIAIYSSFHEWRDRSGGYYAFGKAASFIKSIHGSLTALSGLPEYEWTSFIQGRKFFPVSK